MNTISNVVTKHPLTLQLFVSTPTLNKQNNWMENWKQAIKEHHQWKRVPRQFAEVTTHRTKTFLQYCSHQYWMGSINLLSFLLHCPCCQLTWQHQEERINLWKNLGNAVIWTRGHGARSKYAMRCAIVPQLDITKPNSTQHNLIFHLTWHSF